MKGSPTIIQKEKVEPTWLGTWRKGKSKEPQPQIKLVFSSSLDISINYSD